MENYFRSGFEKTASATSDFLQKQLSKGSGPGAALERLYTQLPYRAVTGVLGAAAGAGIGRAGHAVAGGKKENRNKATAIGAGLGGLAGLLGHGSVIRGNIGAMPYKDQWKKVHELTGVK